MNNYGNSGSNPAYGSGSGSNNYTNAQGWSGWQYQTPNQPQGQTQQQPTSTTVNANNPSLGENKNVNYVQLNWADLLGGQKNASGFTTTGTSGMQFPHINSGTENSNGWSGTGFHQGVPQDPERAAPTFRISVGNQGDQTPMAQPQYYQSGQHDAAGDQMQSGQLTQDNQRSTSKTTHSRPRPQKIRSIVPVSSGDPSAYVPCGKCLACEQQKKYMAAPNVNAYIVRSGDKGKTGIAEAPAEAKMDDAECETKSEAGPSKGILKK